MSVVGVQVSEARAHYETQLQLARLQEENRKLREALKGQAPTGIHRVVLEFDGGGLGAKLVCPPGGVCRAGISCGLCGRDLHDPESTPCYDCKNANPDECWIKTWFDNEDPLDLLHGQVEVIIDAEWDLDHLVARIVPAEGVRDREAGRAQ